MTVTPIENGSRSRREMLALAAGAFILVLITWQIGVFNQLLYPLRLFVSLVHELGHGLTAILTGGQFLRFEVFPNGAGLAYTQGGSSFLVPQMGYLGAALFGALLLVLTNRVRNVHWVAYGVAALIGGCALLFTKTSGGILIAFLLAGVAAWLIADHAERLRAPLRIVAGVCAAVALALVWSETALRIGLIGALILAAIGCFAPRRVTVFILNFLALTVGLNAFMDIWSLLGNLDVSLGSTPNDAAAMARTTGIPTLFWVILWVVLAAAMMGTAAYVAFIQPIRRARAARQPAPSRTA